MSVEQLRKQRGYLKAKLTITTNFINRIANNLEDTSQEEIEARLDNLKAAYGRFQAISQQLVVLVSEEEHEERDATEIAEFDERHFVLRASLTQSVNRLRLVSCTSPASSGGQLSDGSLARILEQQAKLIQHLSERSNESNENTALSLILEQ